VPKITDIKEQKRKGRFNIYLDGKFVLALPAETLVKAGLFVGQQISKKDIKILKDKDIKSKLYNQALMFLSYRPRSEKEVQDYLFRKLQDSRIGENQLKISDNQSCTKTVERIVSKLKSLGLLDDTEFIKWWLEQRQKFRPKGKRSLRQELRREGIADELISQFLNFSISPETEQETAKKLAEKRREQLKGLTYLKLRQKLTRFLVYRGFSYETIKLVLDEVLSKR